MLGSCILALGLLFALGTPSVLRRRGEVEEGLGPFAVKFYRECEDTECVYNFGIYYLPGHLFTACRIVVSGKALNNTPGRLTSFHGARCNDEYDRTEFTADGEWNITPNGNFFSLNVTSVFGGALDWDKPFWRLREDELDAYSTDSKGEAESSNDLSHLTIRDEHEEEQEDTWQIQGMNRDYRADDHLTYLDFTIVFADGKRESCHLIVPDTKPDSSFYAEPCGGSGFTVSWGYKADTDGGVMTICNPDMHKNAWFGWDGINRHTYLGDSPRNAVRTVDCQ